MKKKIKYFALATLLTAVACQNEDEFLELTPVARQNTENFYLSPEGAIQGINACYKPLQFDYTFSISQWAFGDVASPDTRAGGDSYADQPDMHAIDKFQHGPSNQFTTNYWRMMYIGIFRCNQITEYVPASTVLSDDVKNQIIGQAKFLRGFYFLNLMMVYGPIPVFDKIVSSDQFEQGQGTWDEVFTRIEMDLTDAVQLLPEKSEWSGADLGRATKGAAIGILAKFYAFVSSYQQYGHAPGMFEGVYSHSTYNKWQHVLTHCETLINSGEYALETNYADNWELANENGVESIFEIQFSADEVVHYVGHKDGYQMYYSQGSFISRYQGCRKFKFKVPDGYPFGGMVREVTEGVIGWGFNLPTQGLVDEYESGDSRFKASVIEPTDSMEMQVTVLTDTYKVMASYKTNWNSDVCTGYCAKKYELNRAEMNYNDEGRGHSQPLNIKVLRLADIYLLASEAAMELGQDTKAKDYLKVVRNRAGLSNYPSDAAYANLKDAIYHERRVELAMEAHRFFDLVRWGLADDELAASGFVTGKHERFPIPTDDVDFTGGVLKQNPGY